MIESGFSREPNIISTAECDALLTAVASSRGSRAGTRHLMSNLAVAAVANDPRMLAVAQRALQMPPIPFRATLFEKSGEKNWLIAWHQDTALPLESRVDAAGWGPWSEKAGVAYAHAPASALSRVIALRLHLDDSTEDNGPLRVIPNTHCGPIYSDEEILRIASSETAVTCTVAKGGVIAMRPLVIHASSKAISDAPRRVLHIEYTDALDVAPGARLAIT